jgi:hypothetical protein
MMTDAQLLDHALARDTHGLRRITKRWFPLEWHHLGGVFRDGPNEVREAPYRPARGADTFRVRCTCGDREGTIVTDEPPAREPWPAMVTLHPERYSLNSLGEFVGGADVWLGQCDDCGTIWWKVVR